MEATVTGKGGLADTKKEEKANNNLSDGSVAILKHTFFSLAALEFFQNGKHELYAEDIRVKDMQTGREFSFSLTAKEV
jgi:hypothetical protein